MLKISAVQKCDKNAAAAGFEKQCRQPAWNVERMFKFNNNKNDK